jgi:hypothetical protein
VALAKNVLDLKAKLVNQAWLNKDVPTPFFTINIFNNVTTTRPGVTDQVEK